MLNFDFMDYSGPSTQESGLHRRELRRREPLSDNYDFNYCNYCYDCCRKGTLIISKLRFCLPRALSMVTVLQRQSGRSGAPAGRVRRGARSLWQ